MPKLAENKGAAHFGGAKGDKNRKRPFTGRFFQLPTDFFGAGSALCNSAG